ncbi:hypothetical protein [Odoribacter lunatus]|uniref:hypothetical protein n=1 Tax=Odoribacter lunatus TaxID=2941335 RepID=UPI00203E6E39|nr:hypothetical protein [Odoribacter lunatus]
MKRIIHILELIILISISSNLSAQNSRAYIREAIEKWGECRNVAITKTNGDLALYGRNGCANAGCPANLSKAIRELNDDNKYIDDIQLTEEGSWLILFENNGFRWHDIPYSLEQKIRKFNNDSEVITSVTFNDAGDWVVVTTNYISSSDERIQNLLKEGMNKHGGLLTVCLTDDALVAVFEKGYRFFGDVPSSLKTAIEQTKLNVFRLKIAGSSWFFANKKGNYQYNM